MAEINQVNVTILGRHFTLQGDEEPQYIQMLAAYVDDKMQELQRLSPRLSLARVAVLAAINIADEYHKLRSQLSEEQLDEAHTIVRGLLDRFDEFEPAATGT